MDKFKEIAMLSCLYIAREPGISTIGLLRVLINKAGAPIEMFSTHTHERVYTIGPNDSPQAPDLTRNVLPKLKDDKVVTCDETSKPYKYWVSPDWVNKLFESRLSPIQSPNRT